MTRRCPSLTRRPLPLLHLHSSSAAPSQLSSTTYRLQRSHSPYSGLGNEADDESSSVGTRSSLASLARSMSLDEGIPEPSYPGEDTRPTSRKELLGFYAYSFAAEVFVVCGLGAFIPITLEDLARASPSAVLANDHTKSCRAHGIERSLSTHSSNLLGRSDVHDPNSRKGSQCVFSLLGWEMNTASFAMYTFSISVLVQALLVVTMSGAADHGQYRKKLLIGFAVAGAIATMLYLPVTPRIYLLGSLWAIVGNVCFGASFVLLNSFLPLLVRWHPSTSSAEEQPDEHEGGWQENQEVSWYYPSNSLTMSKPAKSAAGQEPCCRVYLYFGSLSAYTIIPQCGFSKSSPFSRRHHQLFAIFAVRMFTDNSNTAKHNRSTSSISTAIQNDNIRFYSPLASRRPQTSTCG